MVSALHQYLLFLTRLLICILINITERLKIQGILYETLCFQMDPTRRFVVKNLDMLLSKDDRKETLKMMKKDFFHRESLKSSESFTLAELAIETIKYLMHVSRIRSEDDLRKFVESSAFLSDFITEHRMEALVGLIKPSRLTILKTTDLGKLRQEDFRRKKEKEFLEAAKKVAEEKLQKERAKAMEEMRREKEHLEQLRQAVQEKIEEVRKMESSLDKLPAMFDPEDYVSTEKEKKPEPTDLGLWWQKLGLLGNPFPTKLGLNRIPEEKYDEVVVFTKIFDEYLRMIDHSPQTLYGKTILIAGQFGSGKTTLIQYISYRLIPYRIIPFQLVLDPIGEIDVLRQNFYSEILTSIIKAMSQRGLGDPRTAGVPLEKGTIKELLSYLSKEAQVDGYVIMIDGLHKAESTIDTSLEFVKQLQNFHEYLNNFNINMSIFVTGSPLWLRKIKQNPAYSGSYYRIDEMPYLTFEDAYKLLRVRFKSFASPNVPIFFDKSTVRFAYDCVWSDFQRGINFRSFIDYILPRLERGNFKEAGISVSVDLEDVRKIDDELSRSVISDLYSYFREASQQKPRLRRACATALKRIYRRRYLGEGDRVFLSNKGAFHVLRKAHLIQKTRTRKGLGWTLSSEFLAALEDLNEQGYPPAIVFQTFSVDPSIALVRESSDDSVLNEAQDFLAKWESEWPEIVPTFKSFLKKHETIVGHSISGDKAKLCKKCRYSLMDLIQCAQIIFKNSDLAEEWVDSTWLDLPIKPNIISILRREDVPKKEMIEYYQKYHHSVTVVLEKLDQLLETNRMINILSSTNRREELRILSEAGNYLQIGDFDSAIEEINSNIEKRIRVAFHLTLSLHHGSNYFQHLPISVQDRISNLDKKGPPQFKRTVDQNLFYHFSRSEYAEVVNNRSNWSSMFRQVFHPKSRQEVVNALRKTFALDDRKQHRDRKDYFRLQREKIREAIVNADWLFTYLAKVMHMAMNPIGFTEEMENEQRKVRISFVSEGQCASSHPWTIKRVDEERIASRLTNQSRIVNFSDDITVSTLFNGAFPEIFIVTALLLKNKRIDVHDSPEGNMYLRIVPQELPEHALIDPNKAASQLHA